MTSSNIPLSNVPLACTLTQTELSARQQLLERIVPAVQEVQERQQGYIYRFASDEVLPALVEIVCMERRCCPFLRFTLTAEPGNGPLWLEVTGPAEFKKFLASFFG